MVIMTTIMAAIKSALTIVVSTVAIMVAGDR